LAVATTEFREVLEIRTENLKDTQKSRLEFTGSSTSFQTPYPSYTDQSPENNDVVISMPMQMQTQTQRDIAQSRLDAVQSIESTMVELEGIFQQLANMVATQQDNIERIDVNVQDTASNMDMSQQQLLKYWGNLTNSRRLTVKIFLVLIVFVIVFVVFFV